jgi:hypothetical protein
MGLVVVCKQYTLLGIIVVLELQVKLGGKSAEIGHGRGGTGSGWLSQLLVQLEGLPWQPAGRRAVGEQQSSGRRGESV